MGEWISIEKRTPPIGKRCFLWWPYWDNEPCIGWMSEDGFFHSSRALAINKRDGVQINGPTHWQPFMEPPK